MTAPGLNSEVSPRDPVRGYWILQILSIPIAPKLLPDYSPRASPIFPFLQASPQNSPLPVERATRAQDTWLPLTIA